MKQVIFFFFFVIAFPVLLPAQNADSTKAKKDSSLSLIITHPVDSAAPAWLHGNKLLNSAGTPVSMAVSYRNAPGNDATFYLLAAIVLLLALLRFFFARYFTNLFRVFFNTSLRQSQLTDQLLQAKLPSLLFNLFFVISGGIYVYSLLSYYKLVNPQNKWILYALCTAVLGFVYVMKFCILKFTGWVTGYKDTTNTYIFIIFLINKIIGIFLLPFCILIAFSDSSIVQIAVIVSLLLIGLLFLLRFFRSYGLLQNQLKVSRFQFFLYIIGIELLPLLLIYKGLMLLLSKNL